MSTKEHVAVLMAEKLHYTLEYDLGKGKQLFLEMIELRDPVLEKLLPGEVNTHIDRFQSEDQFDLYDWLAQIEQRLGHRIQALAYAEKELILSQRLNRSDKQVEALIRLHNSTWQWNPEKSLQDYLFPALKISEEVSQDLLPRTQYEIGFTYRQMQIIEEAINWYEKAKESILKYPVALAIQATLLNDLGYAYTFKGEYERSKIHVNEALNLRQQHLQNVRKKIRRLKRSNQIDFNKKNSQMAVLEAQESTARVRVGLTHNTMGQIFRYVGNLEEAVYHHTQALQSFKTENEYNWQARALASRGEVYRRLSKKMLFDPRVSKRYGGLAKKDLEESLFLFEKYPIKGEKDTTHRRMGRLIHDQALELKKKRKSQAIKLLNEAQKFFEQALVYARESNNVREELENLTEIAFLVDDMAEITGISEDIQLKYDTYINQLSQTIEKHRQDEFRIYQFEVFQNLLKLEQGAYALVQGKLKQALEFYIDGYKGLASDEGYGSARFRSHLDHLQVQIAKIQDNNIAQEWCIRFIKEWQKTILPDSDPPQTLAQIHPELVEWCRFHQTMRGVKGENP